MNTELQDRMSDLSEGTQEPITQAALIFGAIVNGGNITDPAVQKAIEDAKKTAETTNDPAQWITGLLAEAATNGSFAIGTSDVTQAELDAEVDARKAADVLIDSQWKAAVATEAAIRAQRDAELEVGGGGGGGGGDVTQAQLDAERNARIAGDAIVTSEWQLAIANEVVARNAAIAEAELGGGGGPVEVTQAELDAEVAARVAGDNVNAVAISSEVTARTAADVAITTARIAGDTANVTLINNEAVARTAADAALSSRIDAIEEDPFIAVDDEAGFDAALTAGRSIWLRGEGHGGVVTVSTIKEILAARTTVRGPGHLQFDVSGLANDARCFWMSAPDITLRDFEFTSNGNMATANHSGINIPAYEPARAHRLKIQRLDIHNWHSCVDKYGGLFPTPTPSTDDILIEDCYVHTFRGWGIYLTFGVQRATVRRCRVLGKQAGEFHPQIANAFYSSGNIEDLLLEDSTFGMCGNMGIEMTTPPNSQNIRPKVVRCRVVNAGSFGVSYGHSQQGYGEGIIVDGAGGVGIEIGGDNVTGRANATLIGCDVKNVAGGSGTSGYTVDGAVDTMLLGCRATNITSTPTNESNGVFVLDSDRVSIHNCVFKDAGGTGVQLWQGMDFPNTGGFHVVQGCIFRQTYNVVPVGPLGIQRSIFVSNINAIIRHNTAFQRPGGTMGYSLKNAPGANVWCDLPSPIVGVIDPATGEGAVVDFTGSNTIIPVPA